MSFPKKKQIVPTTKKIFRIPIIVKNAMAELGSETVVEDILTFSPAITKIGDYGSIDAGGGNRNFVFSENGSFSMHLKKMRIRQAIIQFTFNPTLFK